MSSTILNAAIIALLGTLASAGAAVAGPAATQVPEPASLGLMAVGVGAVALYKFRRRK